MYTIKISKLREVIHSARTVYQMFLMEVAPTTAPLSFSVLPPRNLVKSIS